MTNKIFKRNVTIAVLVFVISAIIVEVNILSFSNKRQVFKTAQAMLEQVDSIITANEKSEENTLKLLKAEYIETANTVAYILDNNEAAKSDNEELIKIAKMMNIDEINLFDENGVIFYGTHLNYCGVSFDSGEQTAFFKPMLEDKTLTMCQDVTPNFAEGKSMMYAITWNRTGSYMVQVGIEPIRLFNEMERNSIERVIGQFPTYEGVDIYVADIDSGEIIGSTVHSSVGGNLCDIGVLGKDDDSHSVAEKTVQIDGYRTFCNFQQHGDYLIAVVHSTKSNVESFAVAIIVEIIWLIIAAAFIVNALFELEGANRKIKDQMSIVSSISDIYYSMHLINIDDFSIEKIESNELMDKVMIEGQNAKDMLTRIVDSTIEDDYKEAALEFIDLTTIRKRLTDKNFISMDAIDKNVGWLRMTFISVDADSNNMPTKVIVATQIIEDDKKREEELINRANRDELTGLFNRRAYEDDILNYPSVPPEADFVYAAIDVNGLKVVNDSMGHMAGDELIEGAAKCLKQVFGNYGRVYRTGGDEFVSIFFADEGRLEAIKQDLDRVSTSWSGLLVDSLSLAVGYVTKRELQCETLLDIAKVADQRMYQAKAEHYAKKGIDRRGQAAAHKALCNLYTKILKINITYDNYSIVNMDETEQTIDKGFSSSISEWLIGFGKSGQVHPDDLEYYLSKTNLEYLRKYFMDDKTSISIRYRRKYEDGFKEVVMDMIPADDYTNDNQSLFLYVKSVDK